jgi:hypothetical protein
MMSKCPYCGEEAGFLRKIHKECQQKHDDGVKKVLSLAQSYVYSSNPLDSLDQEINQVTSLSFIYPEQKKDLLIQAWGEAVDKALDDGVISPEEESSLIAFKDYFSLSSDDLDSIGAWTKVVKAAILCDILEGNIPDRVQISGSLPFNFQKNEKLVWLFQNVEYYEEKSRRRFEGGSRGVSVRIAKGMYYRVGGFSAHPVVTQETVHIDTGQLAVTNKHLYFAGDRKAFKLPYNKIVAFNPFNDGIGIQRDAMTSKPQSFQTGDGWFTYNLVVNLAKMGAG